MTLRELVGIDQAKLLTYTGRKITGEQAASLGLVTAALDDPMVHAVSIAREIASRSPDSVAVGKKLLQANWTASERAALARERRQQFLLMLGANFKESVKANFEKRAPSFVPRSWLS